MRLGQFVNVGTQVIAVVPLPNIWVIANYKETQMTNIRIGQPARIAVDAFPDLKLTGHVDSWSPGTGSTFALLPPDNATGNFTKVVQRVPVKIVLDQNASLGSLVRPGMSVEATIDTGAPPARSGGRRRKRRADPVTAVPAPLASTGAEAPVPAPITCAGIAAHASGTRYIRLSADSLRPYIGILGVLIGAILSFTGSRITTFGLADLRGGLHFGFDEGAWMTTSFGVGQMLDRRRLSLSRRHFQRQAGASARDGAPLHRQPARTVVTQPQCLPHGAVSRRRGHGHVHPAHHRLHRPQSAAAPRRLRPRRLCDELGTVAERLGLARGLVHGQPVTGGGSNGNICVALPLMFACIWYGAPREKINIALLRDLDWPGLVYSGFGFAFFTPASTRATASTGSTTVSSMGFCCRADC